MDEPALANDRYRATLRSTFIDGVDTTLTVTAIPTNLPTNVTVGWNTQYETVFRVEGTSGTNSSNYALTGITKIKGYAGNLPEATPVNCLNGEEFFNQYGELIANIQEVADDAADDASEALTLVQSVGDWRPYTTVTPTRASADDPTYVLTFAGVDLTSILSIGMKIQITQSTVKYFFVTKISFSTDTTLTLYGGTDYDVADTGSTAITAFSYSVARAPLNFPMDPIKWTETAANVGTSQGSPVANTWYNLGSSLSIPIGSWFITYMGTMYSNKNTATSVSVESTLSTANNSESDVTMSSYFVVGQSTGNGTVTAGGSFNKSKHLLLTSKTTHYANVRTATSSSLTVAMTDADSGTQKVTIKAICAYL